jgi:hypothetical protein
MVQEGAPHGRPDRLEREGYLLIKSTPQYARRHRGSPIAYFYLPPYTFFPLRRQPSELVKLSGHEPSSTSMGGM